MNTSQTKTFTITHINDQNNRCFTLNLANAINKFVEFYTINGSFVFSNSFINESTIDLSFLPIGLYLAKIDNEFSSIEIV